MTDLFGRCGGMAISTCALGAWIGLASSPAMAQDASDPALDPAYQPEDAGTDPGQTPQTSTPAANPTGTQPGAAVVVPATGAPGSGTPGSGGATSGGAGAPNQVHPATVKTVVDPDDPVMVAPPPGWQLARPVYLNGRLYYAVDDAKAYLEQAGWRGRPVVHTKSQTGFRFDLILVPAARAGSAVRTTLARSGSGIAIDTGLGVHTGLGLGNSPWNWGSRYVSRGSRRYVGPIDGQLSPGYSPPIPEPEPVVLTLMEQAGLELGFGDPERAIGLYREHLDEDPDDMTAVRALGVTLLVMGHPEDAAATVRYAYVTDPAMAEDPLGAWIAGDNARELREMVASAVRHANKADSASSWVMVAVLMQAQGRPAVALKMLERSAQRGLDLEVARAMRGELTRR